MKAAFALDRVKCNGAWTLPEPWTQKNAPTAPWKTAQNAVSHATRTII
jgi:hypothetical protein